MVACKDCVYAKPGPWQGKTITEDSECTHPKAQREPEVNFATGEAQPAVARSCWSARGWPHLCGPDGKLFTPAGDAPPDDAPDAPARMITLDPTPPAQPVPTSAWGRFMGRLRVRVAR